MNKPDPKPFIALQVAEVEYLRARGWIPVATAPGRISWKDPQQPEARLYTHPVAVETQRMREPDEWKN